MRAALRSKLCAKPENATRQAATGCSHPSRWFRCCACAPPQLLGLASKLIHILERRSIPPSCVVRRLNRLAIRAPLALLDEYLDAPKCKLISTRALSSKYACQIGYATLVDPPIGHMVHATARNGHEGVRRLVSHELSLENVANIRSATDPSVPR